MLLVALALALSAAAARGSGPPAPTSVHFDAADGIKLAGNLLLPKKGRPAFVFLHGVGAGRGEWSGFAARLASRGFGSLAVDFRGHGESGGPAFTTFRAPEDWAKLEQDVQAAVKFLAARGVPRARIGVVGASIGANLAAKAAAKDGKFACVALLSPGLEYQGVGVEAAALKIARPLLVAASASDRYAFETVRYLKGRLPAATALQPTSGHGAQMFADETFTVGLLAWLDANCWAKP